jgi:hypothetical protein
MPTSLEILDYATQITLDSIWNSMVQDAIHNSHTGKTYNNDNETSDTIINDEPEWLTRAYNICFST